MFHYCYQIRYLEELLKSSLEEGVQYMETRKSLSAHVRLYVLDRAAVETNGKRVIDEYDGELEILLRMEVSTVVGVSVEAARW